MARCIPPPLSRRAPSLHTVHGARLRPILPSASQRSPPPSRGRASFPDPPWRVAGLSTSVQPIRRKLAWWCCELYGDDTRSTPASPVWGPSEGKHRCFQSARRVRLRAISRRGCFVHTWGVLRVMEWPLSSRVAADVWCVARTVGARRGDVVHAHQERPRHRVRHTAAAIGRGATGAPRVHGHCGRRVQQGTPSPAPCLVLRCAFAAWAQVCALASASRA